MGFMVDGQGFPVFDADDTANQKGVHMLISGCQATLRTGTLLGAISPDPLVLLTVKPTDKPVFYMLSADNEQTDPSGAVSELMKIKDSIRITKVK